MYTAATVLVAGRLRKSITAEIGEDKLMSSWYDALAILQRYAAYSTSAQRSLAALQILHDKVPATFAEHQKSPYSPKSGFDINPKRDANGMIEQNATTYSTAQSARTIKMSQNWPSTETTWPDGAMPGITLGRTAYFDDNTASTASQHPANAPLATAPMPLNAAPAVTPGGSINFDAFDFSVDVNDMSWLNSVPFNL